MDNRTISRQALNTVVNVRLMELFSVIRDTLEDQGLLQRLHAGIVLTGGGAKLRNIDVLAERTIGASTRIGVPIHVDGLDDVASPTEFATIAGALLYASRNYEEKSILDVFGRFFRK